MGVIKPKTVGWFDNNKGKLTYSMTGSRNGADGTADCSGSITQAVRDAGGIPYDYLYSTITLDGYLARNGYKRISINQEWDAKEGDVVLMSWGKDMSTSGGAGGHVGLMKDDKLFISVDYWTGGQGGTAVSEHDFNHYYNTLAPRYFEVWRLDGEESNSVVTNQPAPQPAVKNDVDYMRQHGYVIWNNKQFKVDDRGHVNGMWQVISCELGGLPHTATTSATEWTNNGVPMSAISWTDGTPDSSTQGNRFKFDQDTMAIVDYDVPTNGIAVMVAGFKVWVDATVAKKA